MGPVRVQLEFLERLTKRLGRATRFLSGANRKARERLGMGVGKLRRSHRTSKRKSKRRVEQNRRRRKKEELGYEGRWLGPK